MKTLVILVHPDIKNSVTNKKWKEKLLEDQEEITVHELYKEYPDEKINIEKEQKILEKYGHIIFQFPLYWFSSPSFLKKYFDEVFTYGWAYGSEGNKLNGKKMGLAVTVGGKEEYYSHTGENYFSIEEILVPFRTVIKYVGAKDLPFFYTYGNSSHITPRLTENILEKSAENYLEYIKKYQK